MYCPNCGISQPIQAKFCTGCGNSLQINELMNCPDCHGKGEVMTGLCDQCSGNGWFYCNFCADGTVPREGEYRTFFVTCPHCGGSQRGDQCLSCRGTGQAPEQCSTCTGTGQLSRTTVEEMLAQRKKQDEERLALEKKRIAHEEEERKKREVERKKREVERKRQEEERNRKEVEESARRAAEQKIVEEARKQRLAEEERQEFLIEQEQNRILFIQQERQINGRCRMCGRSLNVFDKLSGKIQHASCSIFKE